MKKLTLIGITLTLLLGLALWQQKYTAAAKAAPLSQAPTCPTSFTVNDPGDADDDNPGDGICATAGNVCTLRAAIEEANAITVCTPLTINFSVTGVINLATVLPNLGHPNLTINGPGASQLTVRRSTVAGTPEFRIFLVSNNKIVRLLGLTINNGKVSGGNFGGGVEAGTGTTLTLDSCVISGNSTAYFGGGITSFGTLNLNHCLISGNQADNAGGLLMFGGSVTMSNTTFSGNTATFQIGGFDLFAGANATLTNCTISGNTAGSFPGAIRLLGSGTVTLTNCTVSDNQSNGAIGGIEVAGSSSVLRLQNTIVASNDGPNLHNSGSSGMITSLGNNLTSDDGGGFLTGSGDQINTHPLLAPLGDYGGPTPTHALLPGSPAINTGSNALAVDANNQPLTTDQRGAGFPRIISGTVDIGALESNTAPTITGTTLSRQAGGPASSSQIATVSDAEDAEDTLNVTATPLSGSGVTINGISVDANGNVTANIAIDCAATTSEFTLRVTDSTTLFAETMLTVTVTPDVTPPDTNLTSTPPALSGANVSFSFTGSDNCPVTFECKLDSGAWTACASPQAYNGLSNSAHTFQVRAKDTAGNVDPTPATYAWHSFVASCGTTVNPASFVQASLAIPFAQALSASPSGSYSFSLFAGTLPPGLQIVNTVGIYTLKGTPTTPGTFTFTILARKNNSTCEGIRTYTMTIAPTVVPKVNCKILNANGSYTVWFGYENSTGAVVTIPVGANNFFTSGAQDRGQTTVFQPGVVNNAFSVAFANAGAFTSWSLRGPDGMQRGVAPSVISPNCP